MQIKSNLGAAAIRLAVPATFLLGACKAEADFTTSSNTFPSVDGVYVQSSAPVFYNRPGVNIELLSLRMTAESNGPPLSGPTFQVNSFFDVFTEISINGAPPTPMNGVVPTPVTVQGSGGGAGGLGAYNTEMLQLDLNLGNGLFIRESPTLPSAGQTTIADQGGGTFRISSFFDIFTELSIDGGSTWIPSNGPSLHVDAMQSNGTPEPSTFAAIGLGVIILARRRRV